MMRKKAAVLGSMMAVLLLAGCGTSGGLGDILGGSGNTATNELRGVVDYVDVNSRSIVLRNVTGNRNMLSNSGSNSGDTVRVYYDDQTSVEFQGQRFKAEDLERGDEIAVTVDESNNRLVADRVTVLRDVRTTSGGNWPDQNNPNSGGAYDALIRGTVRNVDLNRRTIEVDRGYGSTTVVEFGTNTPVYYGGRSYRPENLERGDEIEIRTANVSGRTVADSVTVTRSISAGGSSSGTGTTGGTTTPNYGTVRGTVRNIDTYRRTIELEQATWVSGYLPDARTIVVQYDTNAMVDVGGGQSGPVSNLERGDMVEIQVNNTGGSSYVAQRIFLVRDVRR